MNRDKNFMSIALDLARLGLGRTSPNPAVGAVLVKNGKIIGRGFHKKAGMPHAEIEAIGNVRANLVFAQTTGRSQGSPLQDATLYVTLEPCCHYGRTPPCTEAILKSGIRNVVIGMKDPDLQVSGKGIQILRKNGIRVRVGILEKECHALNLSYIKHRTTGLPFVILKIASTLDGKVAMQSGESRWITGSEAREFGHRLRDRSDAILIGIQTVLKDNPQLTSRGKNSQKDPLRIVLDSQLMIPFSAKILKVRKAPSTGLGQVPTCVVTTVKPTHPKVSRLEKMGTEIIFCHKNKKGQVDLKDLLKQLGRRSIVNLLVEGGPTVASSFVREKLVDHLFLFLAPSFLGEKGISMFSDLNIASLRQKIILKKTQFRKIGEDILIEASFR